MMNCREITEVCWQDVEPQIRLVNRELADIINKISPDNKFKLIKATYLFGDLILKNGMTYLPHEEGILPITDSRHRSQLRNQLNYSTIPLFLTLTKSNEVFIDTGSRIIPLNLFNPGNLLGLFESLDMMFGQSSAPNWSVSAGARSIFMLPKISESSGYKRLRMQYAFPSATNLKSIASHWDAFAAIAKHPNFNQPWKNEILFFTSDWLTQYKNDPAWIGFHHYLYKNGWQQAKYSMSKIEMCLYWESFVDAISSRNLKPTPYLADQVKHILAITAGKSPGFIPADQSQEVAPTQGLQDVFIETYILKQYLPTIMHAYLPKVGTQIPVYYSLSYPTLLEGSPNSKSASTIMLDLRDIKLLLETINRSFDNQSRFRNNVIKEARFEYFHVEDDMYQEIKSSRLISGEDARFTEGQKKFADRDFCATSSFWRGSIRIIS